MNQPNALVIVSQAISSPEMQQQLGKMLPPNVPLDRFTEVTMMALRQSPEVLQADRQTLYDSCLSLARRGLLPDKKEAALVVFNTNVGTYDKPIWVKQVQAMPMVEGIIKEMGKAGVKAYANSVYANDGVRIWNDDDGQHILHEPIVFGDRGPRVGVFAAGKTADGRTYVEAMSMEDVAKVRSRSKQKDKQGNPTGTWKSDPERMEQKSALHRLRKRIPILDASDALQNLKDFEEESDVELEESRQSEQAPAGTSSHTTEVSAGPVLEGDNAPKAGQRQRPRALQSVVDQTKPPVVEQLKEALTEAMDKAMDQPHHGHGEYEGEDII